MKKKITEHNKIEQLRDYGYNKRFILMKAKVLELRDNVADWDVWQNLVERIGGAAGEVDDYNESSTEVKD